MRFRICVKTRPEGVVTYSPQVIQDEEIYQPGEPVKIREIISSLQLDITTGIVKAVSNPMRDFYFDTDQWWETQVKAEQVIEKYVEQMKKPKDKIEYIEFKH